MALVSHDSIHLLLSYEVDNAVPGVKPEDVDITIQDNVLIIRGETRQEQQPGATPAQYHVVERRYGRFSRAVSFPTTVNAGQVRAILEHGILHLEIAKADQVKPRKITVRTSNAQHQTVDVTTENQHSQARGQETLPHPPSVC